MMAYRTYLLLLLIGLFGGLKGFASSPLPFHYFSSFSDTDGVPDAADLDDDNDGIPDLVEGSLDTDNDGILDRLDLDSDGDGLSDLFEAGGIDADNDGLVDGFTDTNGNGYHDAFESGPLAVPDSDIDGFYDFQDIDSDADGIVDIIEAVATTSYTPPLNYDADGDGWDATFDVNEGGTAIVINDMDEDGVPDYLDVDSDNDMEADLLEGWDANGDGTPETVPSILDSDNDGLDNAFDDDGSGISNFGGATNDDQLPIDFPDADVPGLGDLDWREDDRDADGVSNRLDEDDDNDGIPDYVEVCGSGETSFSCTSDPVFDDDGDGIANYRDSDFCALNSKGVCVFLDFDNDGIIDPFDADSDNDGVSDVHETIGIDANGDAKVDDLLADGSLQFDSDGNGLSDSSTTLFPRNADDETRPDFMDLDADNDGIYDLVENGGIDGNEDGLVDALAADSSLIDDGDLNGFSATAGAKIYRDTDGDGLGNLADLDSDNDGLADILEAQLEDVNGDGRLDVIIDINQDGADDFAMITDEIDSDEDGIADWRDFDSDNDLIADAEEMGGTDLDSDGKVDGFIDANLDGWSDDSPITIPTDTDGDGTPDYLSADSEGDGIQDIYEAGQGIDDLNGDGVVDAFEDSNQDGWHDLIQLSTGTVWDTDGDGIFNYQDLDSDGDGALDIDEWDSNGDGTVADDCNENGIVDYLDAELCIVFVPEGFSPDGDGINDRFVIGGVDYFSEGRLTVYNRWGKKVFQAQPYLNNWDGTNQFAGDGTKTLPVGTYFYVFEPEQNDASGSPVKAVRGSVYLQR